MKTKPNETPSNDNFSLCAAAALTPLSKTHLLQRSLKALHPFRRHVATTLSELFSFARSHALALFPPSFHIGETGRRSKPGAAGAAPRIARWH